MIIDTALPALISDYNLVSGKPGIRFFEGVEGLKKIYEDVLQNGENFYLVRSAYEPAYKEKIVPVIDEFIKKMSEKRNVCNRAYAARSARPKNDSRR